MINSRRPGSILVTGAARGIGRAIAELFLSRGWQVGMYDVDGASRRPSTWSGGATASGGRESGYGACCHCSWPRRRWRATRRAASVGHLGVRLTAEDVAAAAWRVVHERRVPFRGPHRPVGGRPACWPLRRRSLPIGPTA